MKKNKILVLCILGFLTLLCFTSLPLKLVEYWARVNGFHAVGFSGSLFSRISIREFGDENSKRGFQLQDLNLSYSLYPHLVIHELSAKRAQFYRNSMVQTQFAKRIVPTLLTLNRPIHIGARQVEIQKLQFENLEYRSFKGVAPIAVSNFSVQGLTLGQGRIQIQALESQGENLQISQSEKQITLQLKLPKDFFSDITTDLEARIVLDRDNLPRVKMLALWTIAEIQESLPNQVAPEKDWLKYFADPADAKAVREAVLSTKLLN